MKVVSFSGSSTVLSVQELVRSQRIRSLGRVLESCAVPAKVIMDVGVQAQKYVPERFGGRIRRRGIASRGPAGIGANVTFLRFIAVICGVLS
jgi:hypothetical protein